MKILTVKPGGGNVADPSYNLLDCNTPNFGTKKNFVLQDPKFRTNKNFLKSYTNVCVSLVIALFDHV